MSQLIILFSNMLKMTSLQRSPLTAHILNNSPIQSIATLPSFQSLNHLQIITLHYYLEDTQFFSKHNSSKCSQSSVVSTEWGSPISWLKAAITWPVLGLILCFSLYNSKFLTTLLIRIISYNTLSLSAPRSLLFKKEKQYISDYKVNRNIQNC